MSTTAITAGTGANPFAQSVAEKPAEKDPLTDKSTFIQLLVAQLKNQNPLNPADGMQFVTQLAQFTNLEQSLEMNASLKTIKDVLTAVPEPAAPTSTTIQP
jgi:flagellar basal-body rod modification protein FlgD